MMCIARRPTLGGNSSQEFIGITATDDMSSHDFDEEDTKPFLIFNRASVDRWLCCFRILSKPFTFGLEIAIFSGHHRDAFHVTD